MAVKMAAAGFTAAAVLAHSLTETTPAALMRMFPLKPASRSEGQPGATASPAFAPGKENVKSDEQAPAAMEGKSSVADAVK